MTINKYYYHYDIISIYIIIIMNFHIRFINIYINSNINAASYGCKRCYGYTALGRMRLCSTSSEDSSEVLAWRCIFQKYLWICKGQNCVFGL